MLPRAPGRHVTQIHGIKKLGNKVELSDLSLNAGNNVGKGHNSYKQLRL